MGNVSVPCTMPLPPCWSSLRAPPVKMCLSEGRGARPGRAAGGVREASSLLRGTAPGLSPGRPAPPCGLLAPIGCHSSMLPSNKRQRPRYWLCPEAPRQAANGAAPGCEGAEVSQRGVGDVVLGVLGLRHSGDGGAQARRAACGP